MSAGSQEWERTKQYHILSHLAHLLALSPPTPPLDYIQRPPLPTRCIQKPMLCPSTPETVGCEVLEDAGSFCCLSDPLLNSVVPELATRLQDAISTHHRENVVVLCHWTTKVKHLDPFDPKEQPQKSITCSALLWSWVDLIIIACGYCISLHWF